MRAIRSLGARVPGRRRRVGLVLAGLFVAVLFASFGYAYAEPAPASAPTAGPVITIKNFTFQGDLTVRPGVTVPVRNNDTVMHTLTAVDGTFSTPTIQPGTSATFKAPAKAGQYPITCNFHPFMEGTLTVGVTTTPPPTTPPPPTASHKH